MNGIRRPAIALKLRPLILSLGLIVSVGPAFAQVSVGVFTPGLTIGINVPVYPQLVRVPGYPVYYAPGMSSNYFFYDGRYWVYQQDSWYASNWYNGPWGLVGPDAVPLYILRVPVSYYRSPPQYFRGWQSSQAPRWDDHWGREWSQQRSGWNQWDRRAAPAPAPLPTYQRQFSGTRYPAAAQQHDLQTRNYRYQSHDVVAAPQHPVDQPVRVAPAAAPQVQHAAPPQVAQQHQPPAREVMQGKPAQREQGRGNERGNEHDKDREKGDERGQQDHKK